MIEFILTKDCVLPVLNGVVKTHPICERMVSETLGDGCVLDLVLFVPLNAACVKHIHFPTLQVRYTFGTEATPIKRVLTGYVQHGGVKYQCVGFDFASAGLCVLGIPVVPECSTLPN